ncbi:hypothetical protein OAT10_00200 [Luminiphilus sp.]|nr:hypothetical protein [Luminiphilus sp.]
MGSRKNLKDLESFMIEAIDNINADRAMTRSLMTDLLIYIKKSEHNHKEVGFVAAKYLETLQRSNEQLVKLAGIIQKQEAKAADTSLSSDDQNQLFEAIQNNKEDPK